LNPGTAYFYPPNPFAVGFWQQQTPFLQAFLLCWAQSCFFATERCIRILCLGIARNTGRLPN
jgi:hypothetical protein